MKFREAMRDVCAYARTKGDDRNLKRMVVVGHSMGGLITRSSVTDPKTMLYDAQFNKPLDQLQVSRRNPPSSSRTPTSIARSNEPDAWSSSPCPHRGSPAGEFPHLHSGSPASSACPKP